jgi:arylsulfatase A-like enzyme
LGAGRGQFTGWAVLALINTGVLVSTLPAQTWTSATERIVHHYYDIAHLLSLGFVSWVVAGSWSRLGPKGRIYGVLAHALLASGLALLVMHDDLFGLIRRQASHGSTTLWYVVDCLAIGCGVAAVGAVAGWLSRPWFRWAGLVAGLGVGITNHIVLRFNYPGMHLFAAWVAALLIGCSLSTLPLAKARPRQQARRLAAVVAIAIACLPSLIVLPSQTVWLNLFRSPGSVLAPMLARVQRSREALTPLVIQGSPWFQSRDKAPDVPPTPPRLAPANGIVIVLTIDALRPDAADGRHADQLPNLEALRRESIEFSNARAPSPSTVTSVTSILTGKVYSGMYWTDIKEDGRFKGAIMPHEDPSIRLPQLLSKGGVRTVHMVSLYGLAEALGVGIGFDEEILTATDYGRASDLMNRTLDRLGKQDESPLFMYIHFVDSHAPYDLAGTHGTEYERYVRELALVDRELGRLLAFLKSRKLEERTILFVSADHGEAFGEHGTNYHAVTLYEEMVRVPLFVKVPGFGRAIVEEPVTLIDLGPTVLDAYGLPTPGAFLGESLVPLIRGEQVKLSRPIAAEGGRRIEALYFADGMKTIIDHKQNTRQVYNLIEDPGELHNLVGVKGSRAGYYLRVHAAFFAAHRYPEPGYEPPWRQF